jgi:hypothetical protein
VGEAADPGLALPAVLGFKLAPTSTNQPATRPSITHPPNRPKIKPSSYLGRDIVRHAGAALRHCLTAVAPRVMTWRQYGEAALTLFQKCVMGRDVADYSPDFAASTVGHFAIHAGACRAVRACTRGQARGGKSFA